MERSLTVNSVKNVVTCDEHDVNKICKIAGNSRSRVNYAAYNVNTTPYKLDYDTLTRSPLFVQTLFFKKIVSLRSFQDFEPPFSLNPASLSCFNNYLKKSTFLKNVFLKKIRPFFPISNLKLSASLLLYSLRIESNVVSLLLQFLFNVLRSSSVIPNFHVNKEKFFVIHQTHETSFT